MHCVFVSIFSYLISSLADTSWRLRCSTGILLSIEKKPILRNYSSLRDHKPWASFRDYLTSLFICLINNYVLAILEMYLYNVLVSFGPVL